MSNRNLSIGAGVPRNWSSRLGVEFGKRAAREGAGRERAVTQIVSALEERLEDKFVMPRRPGDNSVRLVTTARDLIRWDVRDQGRRATCTASSLTGQASASM